MPVAISNSTPPTNITSAIRSIALATDRTGGHANNRGITDHSLAATTGTSASPNPTCRPWVSRYSHDGWLGQSKLGSSSHPT